MLNHVVQASGAGRGSRTRSPSSLWGRSANPPRPTGPIPETTFHVPEWVPLNSPDLDQAIIHTLGFFLGAHVAEQPGHFTSSMIEALSVADPQNWAKVNKGLPELAAAVRLYKSVEGGLEWMRARVHR